MESHDNKLLVSKCPEISKDIGKHHHPFDCSKFIICNGSEAEVYRCRDGFLYDRYKNECRMKANVDCGKIPINTLPSGHEVTDDATRSVGNVELKDELISNMKKANYDAIYCLGRLDGVYKYAYDCRVFYKCSRGITNLKRCPEGLLFNEVDEVCDWPKHVIC